MRMQVRLLKPKKLFSFSDKTQPKGKVLTVTKEKGLELIESKDAEPYEEQTASFEDFTQSNKKNINSSK